MATAFLVLLVVACLAPWASAETPIVFEDMTKSTGLAEVLEAGPAHRAWRYAHGAGWGDVDGDGRPELYVGAFAARAWFSGADAPRPNWLLWNRLPRFVLADAAAIEFRQADARCSGVLFADLDNDGDLDLLVANHVLRPDNQGCRLFENRGDGTFRDVTPRDGDWPSKDKDSSANGTSASVGRA